MDKPRSTKDFNEYYNNNIYRFSNGTFEIILGKREGYLSMNTLTKFMNLLEVDDLNELITFKKNKQNSNK